MNAPTAEIKILPRRVADRPTARGFGERKDCAPLFVGNENLLDWLRQSLRLSVRIIIGFQRGIAMARIVHPAIAPPLVRPSPR